MIRRVDLRPYLQFNRGLSSRLTAILAKTPVTPNLVTLCGLAFGVLAGFAMAGGTRGALLAGAALLHVAFILDNCDGELARLKNKASVFGKRLDMTCDLLVDFALWTGLGAGAAVIHHEHWAWVGIAAGIGSVINFCMVVYERRHGHSTSTHIRKEIDPAVRDSTSHSLLETLIHNGDVIALVWILAAIGSPAVFLIAGSIYIHLIWIFRSSRYFPKQSTFALRAVFTALGIWLLHRTAMKMSWAELGACLREAGWAASLAFLVFPLIVVFHAQALHCLLPASARRTVPFRKVYRIALFGEAVNKITPFVDIGGEPIKIDLLVRSAGLEALQAARAVWFSRVIFILAEAVYLVPAVALVVLLYPSEHFTWVGGIAILLSLIYAGIVFGIQRRTIGAALPSGSNPAASLAWHLAGWTFATVETHLILELMHLDVDFVQAFLVQALLQAITSVSFFIPANIGAQEGGLALLLQHLGFSSEGGVALSLLKRARQFFWAVAAFGMYWMFKKTFFTASSKGQAASC